MIYDPVRDRLVVFGGNPGAGAAQDTWTLDLTVAPAVWTLISTTTSPAPRLAAGTIYDPAGDRMIIFGGIAPAATYFGDAWALSLSGTPNWAPIAAPNGPSPRHSLGMVYDAAAQRVILYGGESLGSSRYDVWELTLNGSPAWNRLGGTGTQPALNPLNRQSFCFALDRPRHRALCYGGEDPSVLEPNREVWSLRLDAFPSWTRLITQGTGPGSLQGARMTYDGDDDVMLVFGGFRGVQNQYKNDLWSLSLSGDMTWSVVPTLGVPPSGRDYQSATFDPLRQRIVFLGGNSSGGFFNDLYTLDITTKQWTSITSPTASPSPRLAHQMVYDPMNDRFLMYGGVGNGGEVADVWALDPVTFAWTELPVVAAPGPRHSHRMEYDPFSGSVLMFGGYDGTASTNSTWRLSLDPLPTWTQLMPTGGPPQTRHGAGMIFDADQDRLVVHAGYSGPSNQYLNDTWQLKFADGSTATLAAVVTAEAFSDRVKLVWFAGGARGTLTTIMRRTENGPETAIGSVEVDASDRVTVEDPGVTPGARYGYRLILHAASGDVVSSLTWVVVPGRAALAVEGFTSNPVPQGFELAFALPDNAPATLELLDVAGRRIAVHQVGAMGAGRHSLRLVDHAIPAGVYFARLTHGSQRLVLRGVHVR